MSISIHFYALASCLLAYSMRFCPLCLNDVASQYDETE